MTASFTHLSYVQIRQETSWASAAHPRPACGWAGKREEETDIRRRAKRTEHVTGEEDGEEDQRELGEESIDSESIGKGDGVSFHLLDPWHRL